MKSKLMITGANGFLGARLADYYKERFEVIPVSRAVLDITDKDAAAAYVQEQKPSVVLHCAAISDTGICEKNPELSHTVNIQGTLNLGYACRDNGCRLVAMSSDQIYTGSCSLEPNKENSAVFPTNVYGRHKLQAEEELLTIMPEAVCLRLTWMYDMWVRGKKTNRNMILNLLETLIHGKTYTAPVHEYRGITDVRQVVIQMEQAWMLPGGVYNFGSGNQSSTYEIARYVMSLLAPDRANTVQPDMERFKESPRNLTMDNTKAEGCGIHFTDTKEGFFDFLKEYGW